MGTTTARPPRSLTQMLRELDDAGLADLLHRRPDLAGPEPASFADLASRATTRHSVSLVLQQLTAFDLWVATAASREHAFEPGGLAERLLDGVAVARPGDVAASIERLRALGLVWGEPRRLRPVRALATVIGSAGPPPHSAVEAPAPRPPGLGDTRQAPALVTKVAAGSAFELLVRIEVLVEHCDHQPLRLRRDGVPTTRDVRALAALLDVRASAAASHLELARAAGLLGLAADERDELWLPTETFDAWHGADLSRQWAQLAQAWIDHQPATGERWVKRLALAAFGDPADGRVLTAPALGAWLDWQRPRRPGRNERQAVQILDDASTLGLTGLGALAAYAVPLDPPALADLLPARTDHIVVQADLTAIAPGPLTPEASNDLALLADVESRGGATVYRFSAASLRRARSVGWDSTRVRETLEARSRTPLPQPLTYLVAELDRLEAESGQRVRGPQHPGGIRPRGIVRSDPLEEAVSAIEPGAADEIAARLRTADSAPAPRLSHAQTPPTEMAGTPLLALREAAETSEIVWCGYVDGTGRRTERMLRVTAVDEGIVEAEDASTAAVVRLPLHRITAVHIVRRGA